MIMFATVVLVYLLGMGLYLGFVEKNVVGPDNKALISLFWPFVLVIFMGYTMAKMFKPK